MRNDEYIDGIRGALKVYFEIYPRIKNLTTHRAITETLGSEGYSRYISALNLLTNATIKGDDIIQMLTNGDNSPSRFRDLARILLTKKDIIITKEDI